MKRFFITAGLLISISILTSCVSQQKYSEAENRRQTCESELSAIKGENVDLNNVYTEAKANLDRLSLQHEQLKRDTLLLGRNYRAQHTNYQKLQEAYDDLLKSTQSLTSGNKDEVAKILESLNKLRLDLLKREDDLKMMETEMNNRLIDLEEKERLIKLKEDKINELQFILDNKDFAVNALREKVLAALTGFQNNGLNVYQKNGKVYVSMDEKLLFKTGSYQVDPRGEAALKELAFILENDADISIMIEGHTDDVPYRAAQGQINDNWDLSVLRATSVLKILLKHGEINPKRLTAAGRGEHNPIDTGKTAEARAKNRRTDIILTPKMDELLKILESN